ncbi:lysis system i-spanin subunit Rz [Pseudomonas fluorescens]|uniref:lysis system i-spanin subunit Rz n=1 Tax=Pseudomonas fluorescens TaxID=294 RepID=UPI0006936D49|nr:lysis system i-spanin subunit Rz [Pseudomonas fluorescens]
MLGAMSAWTIQGWRYGAQLAEQSRLHTDTLNQLAIVGAAAQKAEQDKHLVLEQRLAASDKSHHETLTNAQKDQSRLRDRLATSDLRLSVVLAQGSASGCPVPAATGAGGVDHGTVRAELDQAHAQRIVAIINEGDQGLIALAACQAYVKAISTSR